MTRAPLMGGDHVPTGPERFERYCALTCEGGSEARGCRCKGPLACVLASSPDFPDKARQRDVLYWRSWRGRFRQWLRTTWIVRALRRRGYWGWP